MNKRKREKQAATAYQERVTEAWQQSLRDARRLAAGLPPEHPDEAGAWRLGATYGDGEGPVYMGTAQEKVPGVPPNGATVLPPRPLLATNKRLIWRHANGTLNWRWLDDIASLETDVATGDLRLGFFEEALDIHFVGPTIAPFVVIAVAAKFGEHGLRQHPGLEVVRRTPLTYSATSKPPPVTALPVAHAPVDII